MTSSRFLILGYSLLLLASFAAAQNVTIITTSPLPSGLVGAPYGQTLVATGGFTPYTWSVVAGSFPPGLDLSPSGALFGTPSTAGSYSFSVRVTDAQQMVFTRAFTLTISQTGGTQFPDGEVGVSYWATLVPWAGIPPHTWTITSGQLPPGLTLNSGTGVVSGTPTTAGTFGFIAQWRDSQGATFAITFSFRVYPALAITSISPSSAIAGAAGFTLTVTGANFVPPPLNASGPGSQVRWNSKPIPTSYISSTQLQATVSAQLVANPGSAAVDVLNPTSRASNSVTFTILAPLAITTASPWPSGTVGVAYSLNLAAIGGTLPYNWRVVEGALPSGLTLNPSTGVISGTPRVAGAGMAQIYVDDSGGQRASRVFNWTVYLAITTASPLAGGTMGANYSQTFLAAGGATPYTWSLTSGALPPGLTLSTGGVLSGTPTQAGAYSFSVRVTDSSQSSGAKAFTLSVSVPQAPTLSVTGLADTVNPAQQPSFDVELSSAYPLAITGTITLTFTPDAVAPADDPSIQFSSGGRALTFTVPAGETRAFPSSPPAIQAGTVAGRIDLTLRFSSGGQDITPTPAPVRSVQIPRSAPSINSVRIQRTSGGFNVLVTGYSTPRQVTQAVFTFTPSPGSNLGTTQLTVPVDSAFTTWFTGTASGQFGSTFLYTQPFQVQGDVAAITSVSVTLSSSAGSSQPASASF